MQLLLRNISSRREIDFYLKRFGDVDANRFAVVKVGGKTLADELDLLGSSLALLARMGLTPIVVHGAGEQVDAALAAAGVKSDRCSPSRRGTAGKRRIGGVGRCRRVRSTASG
jgi:acetylglutamate kinase